MISFLDRILRRLFISRIPGMTRARVGFEPPNADWARYVKNLREVALNIYLVGFSENLELRSNGRSREIRDGKVVQETRHPRHLDNHYMITAWSPEAANLPTVQPTLDEHELLYKVAAVLVNAEPMVPREIYGASPFPPGFPEILKDAELPSEFLPYEGFPTTVDLWNTMGEPWRPSLNLTVTLPLLFDKAFEEFMVTTRVAEHGQIGGTGAAEARIEIGGRVLEGTPPEPVAAAQVRLESPTGSPRVVPPPQRGADAIYEMRTYESPNLERHLNKLGMFNSGEFGAFERAGMNGVFFGGAIAGPDLPQLTYMVSHGNAADVKKHWSAFGADGEWQKLKADPKYKDNVSKITRRFLRASRGSQI